jgi:glutamine synthetase
MYRINLICEYIWIGGSGEIRSKTRVIDKLNAVNDFSDIIWNYDASSTNQLNSDGDTEGILQPVMTIRDPFRSFNDCINECNCLLVLCDTYDKNGNPLKYNYRKEALKIFDKDVDKKPWFGLEQEYFIVFRKKDENIDNLIDGNHYCGSVNQLERIIAEKHLKMCLEIGIKISGINAEVSNSQWEFQIGPCEGIEAGDHLIIARYLLERICEKYNAYPNYHPKPDKNINGSGCHINFSTADTRHENGIETIYKYINKLEKDHSNTLLHYGSNNHLRLTGLHETSSMDKFTSGIGTRNTSIRIPNHVVKNGCGYLEDRRPAANIDPYDATSTLFNVCCLNE